MAQAQLIARATHGDSLADILERVLNTGLVIAGDIRIKLCDVELLSIQLRLLICSVEKAQELGISWWWQSPQPQTPAPVKRTEPPEKPHVVRRSDRGAIQEQPEPFWRSPDFQQAMHALERGPR
jgi:hypothetical protein